MRQGPALIHRSRGELRRPPRTVFLLIVMFGWSSALRAQSSGEFVGTVTDPSGAPVAGARVTTTETATGLQRTTVTGAEGFYTVPSLRPASYKISVEAPGFRTSVEPGITLEADQKAT